MSRSVSSSASCELGESVVERTLCSSHELPTRGKLAAQSSRTFVAIALASGDAEDGEDVNDASTPTVAAEASAIDLGGESVRVPAVGAGGDAAQAASKTELVMVRAAQLMRSSVSGQDRAQGSVQRMRPSWPSQYRAWQEPGPLSTPGA
jgi:hypothetical protein